MTIVRRPIRDHIPQRLLRERQDHLISPQHVRLSMAAAIELGLKPGRLFRGARCGCINLLLNYPIGCYANCAYCGLARERPGIAADTSFIRVSWPVVSTDQVVERIAERQEEIGRVCIAMVHDPRSYPDLIEIAERIRSRGDILISGLVMATLLNEERLRRIRHTGIDIIGIGLDAATEEAFHNTRGRGVGGPHEWEYHWEIARLARELFGPFRVNCHVIIGLGEDDRDLVGLFARLKAMEVAAYLFSFNPEPGTLMQDVPRQPIQRHRRIQLVKHLIEEGDLPPEAVRFDAEGFIDGLDAPPELIEEAIHSGLPFMTDGCPDRNGELACNRPYGSYRPGQEFRDYPFRPLPDDLAVIRREMRLEEILW